MTARFVLSCARLRSWRLAAFATLAGIAAAGALLPAAQAQQTPQNVYATTAPASGPTNLNGFAKDATTGALTTATGSPLSERLDGAAMAVDALGRFLFVANPTNNDISMLQINAATGALTEVPTSPFAAGGTPTSPVALATEPTGQYLFAGYSNGDGTSAVETYLINTALLQLVPVQLRTNGSAQIPLMMTTDFRGRNLYLAYTVFAGDSGGILTYPIDSATGALAQPIDTPVGSVGRSLALDPQARFVYLGAGTNEGLIDDWTLSPVDSLPTANMNHLVIGIGAYPFAVAAESTGKYLFAATSGGAHSYAIDPTSGAPTEVTGSPQNLLTGVQSPRLLVADPEGPHLYSLDSAGVHAFQINLTTGLLTEISGSPYAIANNSGQLGLAITGTASGAAISGPFPQFDSNQMAFPDTVVSVKSGVISDRLVNNGGQALLISSISATGANFADFSVTHNCAASLGAGAFCTINVTFTPLATGLRQALLDVADNGPGGIQAVALSGTGLAAQPAVTFVPCSLTFTAIPAGTTSAPQSVMVTNSGINTLNVSSVLASGANPGDFTVGNGCTGAVLPVSGSCSVSVTFAPQAQGQRTASLSVADNAPNSPQSLNLAGQATTTSFTISPASSGSSTAAVTAGHGAQFALQLTPAPGFSGLLQLQCTGAPTGSTCMVSPSITQVTNGAPNPVPVTVTVTTTAASATGPGQGTRRITPLRDWQFLFAAMALLAFLLAATFGHRMFGTLPRRLWALGATAAVLFAAMTLVGCGGGGGSGSSANSLTTPPATPTPTGTYTLTLTANWSNVIVSDSLTLTVQ